MKITELMEILKETKAEYGDVKIYLGDPRFSVEINSAEFEEEIDGEKDKCGVVLY